MQLLQSILPLIITSALSAAAGGWLMYRRKSGAVSAALANEELTDVGEMVANYTAQLGQLTTQITELNKKVIHLEGQVAQLKGENTVLREHIARLEK